MFHLLPGIFYPEDKKVCTEKENIQPALKCGHIGGDPLLAPGAQKASPMDSRTGNLCTEKELAQ